MRLVVPALLVVALSGCTHTYSLAPAAYPLISERAERRAATVTLRGSGPLTAQGLLIDRDSTSWLEFGSGRRRVVATADVERVSLRDRGQGAFEGFALGAAAGAALGAAVAATAYREGEADIVFGGRGKFAGVIGVLVGAVGGGVGVIVGGRRGTTNVYRAPERPAE